MPFFDRSDQIDPTVACIAAAAAVISVCSLISPSNVVQEQRDPFSTLRGHDALGIWSERQPTRTWFQSREFKLKGPQVIASLKRGFCGRNEVYIHRKPDLPVGQMSWTALLAVFIPNPSAYYTPMGGSTNRATNLASPNKAKDHFNHQEDHTLSEQSLNSTDIST